MIRTIRPCITNRCITGRCIINRCITITRYARRITRIIVKICLKLKKPVIDGLS